MNQYKQFLNIWARLDKATQNNDIDTQNECTTELENILPFKTINQHKKWLNVLMTFKFWEDFQSLTFEIAEGLKENKQIKRIEQVQEWAEQIANEASTKRNNIYAIASAEHRTINGAEYIQLQECANTNNKIFELNKLLNKAKNIINNLED